MRQITEVNKLNLEHYYWREDGNLYYKYPKDKDNVGRDYQILAGGYTLEECRCAMENKVKFIWISGEAI